MALNPANHFSTRAVSMLMLAAFAGVGLWLLLPALGGSGSGSSFGGGNGSAALPPSLKVDGPVQVTVQDGIVRELVVPLTLRGEPGIVLDESAKLRAETVMGLGASAAVPATFAVDWVNGNGDNVLDPGENALMTVFLPTSTSVYPDNPLRLVLTPVDGVALAIENVLD